MDLNKLYRTWLKTTQALVLAGGFGLLGGTAMAEDCAPACAPACEAGCNDQIFQTAGAQLAADIEALAGGQCGEAGACNECDEGFRGSWLDESGIVIGGWTQFGYYADSNPQGFDLNFNDNTTGFGSTERGGLHQQWLYAEKVADGSNGLDWGFRIDAMYGLDADDTQSFGNDDPVWDNAAAFDQGSGRYGFAIPQAYLEVASGDLSVIAGHFYTLIGYEVVTAPDNFFFSHAYTMFNNEPFTHTGVLATYGVSDDVEVYAGWTLGWDTGFDQANGGSNFLGGFSVSPTEDVSVTYITTIGDFGLRGEGYSHSVVVDVALTDNLNYVFQTDLVEAETDAGGGDHQFAINNYLFYTINDMISVGGRAEYWSTSGAVPFGGASGNIDIYEVTAGVNIRPFAGQEDLPFGLIVRPEVRHDWSEGIGIAQNQDFDFTTFAFDVILTY